MTSSAPELVPAASVALLRDRPTGLEVLLLRRSASATFAPGAWVFPGGRVDPGDLTATATANADADADLDLGLGAARRAAVRETAEEAGLKIEAAGLLPLARWCPPALAPRRYLTWILLGGAPDQDVIVDGSEITDHTWVRPDEALRARDRGELTLLPPTWVTLWALARHAGTEDALAAAASMAPELFETRFVRVPGGMVALWHGDAGYPGPDAAADEADADREGARHRLWMVDAGWRYERSVAPSPAEAGPPLRLPPDSAGEFRPAREEAGGSSAVHRPVHGSQNRS